MKSVGTPDQDPAVVREFNSDALQRLSVIDTAAAGLAHAVRGDDADSCGAGTLHQTEACWRATDQDRTEAGQGFRHVVTTQRLVELRRNQRDVAPLRQRVGSLLQVAQIGTAPALHAYRQGTRGPAPSGRRCSA